MHIITMRENKTKLVMLKGLPASGKSTYAKELVEKGYKRVNKDELRLMIDNGKWSKSNEKVIQATQHAMVGALLMTGHNVVVDDTNFAWEKDWKERAEKFGAKFEVMFFDTPVMECIERDAKRGDKSVGAKVIMRMYDQYLKKDGSILPLYVGENLPTAYLFDIDGTIAKMNRRSPYDWKKVGQDIPKLRVIEILKNLSYAGHKIILMSGRDGSCLEETKDWLKRWDIPFDAIAMRDAGDNRKDSIVKQELYEKHIKNTYNVIAVFDDRNQVVDMWRSLGLTCCQVDYGNF